MSAANLAVPLRAALVGAHDIMGYLQVYKDSWPVFTRRPAPSDAPYPMIMISPDITVSDQDGINDMRPIQERDVTVFGLNNTRDNYRNLEDIGYMIRSLFHRQRSAITVSGWHVVSITARGPYAAPTDDDKTIARVVPLTVSLARLVE